jgi:tungstate transport system ATP-binding protein
VHAGEVVGLYGPNGAGKSTLLQAVAGLLPLASGHVYFKGQHVGAELPLLAYHRRTAAVFQEPLLLHGTVWHNVTLGLRLRGVPRAEHRLRAQPWLERLKIAHLAGRSVRTLSAGEAQRTSLARALVLDPEVLFLDEPFAALDAPTRVRLVEELADILAERQIATLFVTHDLTEAFGLSQRCVVLDQGQVLQAGELATIVRYPRTRRVAEITGAKNLFDAAVAGGDLHGTQLDWGGLPLRSGCLGPYPVGMRVAFLIREEDIQCQWNGAAVLPNELQGRVARRQQRSPGWLITVVLANTQQVCLSVSASCPILAGQEVRLIVPPGAVWIVPEAGDR